MDFVESTVLTAEKTLEGISYFGAVIAMLFLGKFVYNRTTKFDFDQELTEKDNSAFSATLAGYIGGLAVALSGTLQATGQGVYWDWLGIWVAGMIAIILMRLGVLINDKLILYKFDNDKEIIEDRNLGAGFVVAGSCLATGFMLAGIMTTNSLSFVDRILDVGIYWAIGQAILVLGGVAFQWFTKYNMHYELEENDNAAVGLMFGGYLVALGIIANAALRGATSNIVAELPTIAIWTVTGMALLAIMKVITDKVVLPRSPLSVEVAEQKNVGAGGVAAASFLAIALLFGTAVNPAAPTQSNIFDSDPHMGHEVKLLTYDGKADPAHAAEEGPVVVPAEVEADPKELGHEQ